jgi:hypothetical protein
VADVSTPEPEAFDRSTPLLLWVPTPVHPDGTPRTAGQERLAPSSRADERTEVASPVTGDEADADVDADVGEPSHALANPRRRVAPGCLRRRRSVALAALAERVVERGAGESVAPSSPERVRGVHLSPSRGHVPTLVDADLARHDRAGDVAAATARTDAVHVRARDAVDAPVHT